MLTTYLGEFAGLAMIHFLAVVAPGPDFAVTVSQSVRFGRLTGIYTALGIGAGISVHVLYTLLGVSALMYTNPWLMTAAKMLGGAYILYLGIALLRSKPKTSVTSAVSASSASQQPPSGYRAFVTGFLTNAMNPKATLFFLAIFTTIVSYNTPLKIQALYGVWMCSINALWFMLVSLFFSAPRIRQAFLLMGHWFERVMGLLLIAFALRLVL